MIHKHEVEDVVMVEMSDVTLRDLLRACIEGPESKEIRIETCVLGWKKEDQPT